MVTDFEQAWMRLQAFIASKPQHGREGTLVRMAEIAEECRVPAGELSRLLRLYGVEVERVRSVSAETDRSEPGDFAVGVPSPVDGELTGHHRTEEVHDGRRSERAGDGGRTAAGRAVRV